MSNMLRHKPLETKRWLREVPVSKFTVVATLSLGPALTMAIEQRKARWHMWLLVPGSWTPLRPQ